MDIIFFHIVGSNWRHTTMNVHHIHTSNSEFTHAHHENMFTLSACIMWNAWKQISRLPACLLLLISHSFSSVLPLRWRYYDPSLCQKSSSGTLSEPRRKTVQKLQLYVNLAFLLNVTSSNFQLHWRKCVTWRQVEQLELP